MHLISAVGILAAVLLSDFRSSPRRIIAIGQFGTDPILLGPVKARLKTVTAIQSDGAQLQMIDHDRSRDGHRL